MCTKLQKGVVLTLLDKTLVLPLETRSSHAGHVHPQYSHSERSSGLSHRHSRLVHSHEESKMVCAVFGNKVGQGFPSEELGRERGGGGPVHASPKFSDDDLSTPPSITSSQFIKPTVHTLEGRYTTRHAMRCCVCRANHLIPTLILLGPFVRCSRVDMCACGVRVGGAGVGARGAGLAAHWVWLVAGVSCCSRAPLSFKPHGRVWNWRGRSGWLGRLSRSGWRGLVARGLPARRHH